MTAFLCISLITDAAKVEGTSLQDAAYDYLRDREEQKVVSEEVEHMAIELLANRDEVYRALCEKFSETDYDSSNSDEVEEVIRDVVTIQTIDEKVEDDIPSGIEIGIDSLRSELLDHTDKDPFKITANLREMILGRNTNIQDYLFTRVDNPNTERLEDIHAELIDATGSEIAGIVCADAAGWWCPRPQAVPITIGEQSPIKDNKEIINDYLRDRTGSPRSLNLQDV